MRLTRKTSHRRITGKGESYTQVVRKFFIGNLGRRWNIGEK